MQGGAGWEDPVEATCPLLPGSKSSQKAGETQGRLVGMWVFEGSLDMFPWSLDRPPPVGHPGCLHCAGAALGSGDSITRW